MSGNCLQKVSGNCLQICRGTVSKNRVRELSCQGTVSIPLAKMVCFTTVCLLISLCTHIMEQGSTLFHAQFIHGPDIAYQTYHKHFQTLSPYHTCPKLKQDHLSVMGNKPLLQTWTVEVQTSLRIHAVLPEPTLFPQVAAKEKLQPKN